MAAKSNVNATDREPRSNGRADRLLPPPGGPQGASHARRRSPSPSPAASWRLRDSRRDCRLAVACADRSLHLELALGSGTLLAGEWSFDVRRDGKPATPVSTWCETCRVSDRDVDYLELRIELAGGLTVERHLVLARKERFLLLADAVLGSRPGVLDYCGTLSLAPGVAWSGARQTREGFLVGKRRALVLPLALPEWRAERRIGELAATDGGCSETAARNGHSETASCAGGQRGLQLRQTVSGRALLAPLFFDLDGRRMSRPATWRQLTVAQAATVQPADVAVGYRVAVGRRQWLIYRSLAAAASRTLLGHNLNGETLVARFRGDGEVESLLEVE
jgi:hypothetical protein